MSHSTLRCRSCPRDSLISEPPLAEIAREWGRIGCIGFGGPPAHIALLRELCVSAAQLAHRCAVRARDRRHQHAARSGLHAACDLLRLAAARRARRAARRALLHPPRTRSRSSRWRRSSSRARRRSGCAAPAWARARPSPPSPLRAGLGIAGRCWTRNRPPTTARRCSLYGLAGGLSAASRDRPLARARARLGCGRCELLGRPACFAGVISSHPWLIARGRRRRAGSGSTLALAWTALKVGALAFGGGFVIVPLMQSDAVEHLPLDEPRPVPQRGRARPGHTRARHADGRSRRLRSGRAARRGLLAALVAFAPSFSFVLIGAKRFERFACEPARARLPGGRRTVRGRSDHGRGDPARDGLRRGLAVRAAGRRRR